MTCRSPTPSRSRASCSPGRRRPTATRKPCSPPIRTSTQKTKGFLDFLNSAKGKASPGAATSADPPLTWSMRVLKPGDVQEVEFEADAANGAADSPSTVWRTTSTAGNAGGGHPPQAEPKTAAPETRRAAAAQDNQPKSDKKDKSANCGMLWFQLLGTLFRRLPSVAERPDGDSSGRNERFKDDPAPGRLGPDVHARNTRMCMQS